MHGGIGGRGNRGREKLRKLQEEVETAGALRWVQRGERERLVALVLPVSSDLLGQGALAACSGLSKAKAEGRARPLCKLRCSGI